jgi:serine protease Do
MEVIRMRSKHQWPILSAVLVTGIAVGAAVPTIHGQFADPPVSVPRDLPSYRDVVKKVLPAVVSIEPKIKIKKNEMSSIRRQIPMLPDGIPEEFRRQLEESFRRGESFQEQIPQNPNLGMGSGFVVDPAGIIMTNSHVVEGADSVEVTFLDGKKFTSTEVINDRNSDIAIVKIKADGQLPSLKFGDSSQMEIGDRVLAVGAPFGLAGSVTQGIISAKGRSLANPRYDDYLQTDAAVNPGNSGGPLVNLAGQVVGVNSAIKSRNGAFQGVAFSVAGNAAKSVMTQLLKDGVVKRGYLGIEMAREVSPEVAARFGLKNGGVVIADVREGSPAAKAGLKVDDAIIAINGKSVRENRELQRLVAGLAIGQTVPLAIVRGGEEMKLTLTIEAQPEDYDVARRIPTSGGRSQSVEVVSVPRAGLDLTDLTEERAQALGMSRKSGALIAGIEQGGPAAEAGLSRGLVIVKVDSQQVATADEAKAALESSSPEKGALVQAVSPRGGTEFVIVKVQK